MPSTLWAAHTVSNPVHVVSHIYDKMAYLRHEIRAQTKVDGAKSSEHVAGCCENNRTNIQAHSYYNNISKENVQSGPFSHMSYQVCFSFSAPQRHQWNPAGTPSCS